MATAAFFTIAFAVNGSLNTETEDKRYNTFNLVIDSCFIADGIVKAISVYSYAKLLETYDSLNARMRSSAAEHSGEDMRIKKYTPAKLFKHGGVVDCVIAIFCLAYNGEKVADWFRLVRIIIISLWALENEPRIAILLSGIAHGCRSMTSLLLLMLLINVIFASIAITTFGPNDPYNFGSMSVAMWSFFEMSTMEGWSTIMAINRKGCDSVPDSGYEQRTNTSTLSIIRYGGEFYMPVCSEPEAQPFLSSAIFLSYMIIVGFILTSVTIGAISTGINERFDVLRSQQHLLELEQSLQEEKEATEQGVGRGAPHSQQKKSPSGYSNSSKSVHFSTDCDDDAPDCAGHHDIYSSEEEENASFTHFNNNSLVLNEVHKEEENLAEGEEESAKKLNREIVSFSDVSSVEHHHTATTSHLSNSLSDFRKSKLFVPPPLKIKGSSYELDQFSFRTCKDGHDKKEYDEKYEIFCTEVKECLDIIALERDVNSHRKQRFVERRSASNTYLRGQLTKTVTGLKKSDLRFNEMKSKDFHILMYKFKSFVYGDTYGFVMLMFILLAALFEIVTLSNPNRDLHRNDGYIFKVQLFMQLLFTMDIFVHFLAMFPRYQHFFFYQWNLFDFVIVLALWLPFMMNILEKYIRLLRGRLGVLTL